MRVSGGRQKTRLKGGRQGVYCSYSHAACAHVHEADDASAFRLHDLY